MNKTIANIFGILASLYLGLSLIGAIAGAKEELSKKDSEQNGIETLETRELVKKENKDYTETNVGFGMRFKED